jgi:hypothetical protein
MESDALLLIFEVVNPDICLEGLRKSAKNLSQVAVFQAQISSRKKKVNAKQGNH